MLNRVSNSFDSARPATCTGTFDLCAQAKVMEARTGGRQLCARQCVPVQGGAREAITARWPGVPSTRQPAFHRVGTAFPPRQPVARPRCVGREVHARIRTRPHTFPTAPHRPPRTAGAPPGMLAPNRSFFRCSSIFSNLDRRCSSIVQASLEHHIPMLEHPAATPNPLPAPRPNRRPAADSPQTNKRQRSQPGHSCEDASASGRLVGSGGWRC